MGIGLVGRGDISGDVQFLVWLLSGTGLLVFLKQGRGTGLHLVKRGD